MQYKSITGYRAQSGGGSTGQVDFYNQIGGIEVPGIVTFVPSASIAQQNLIVLNEPSLWNGIHSNGQIRVWIDRVTTRRTPNPTAPGGYNNTGTIVWSLVMPNICLMSTNKTDPGNFAWYTGGYVGTGNKLGKLIIELNLRDYGGWFTWLTRRVTKDFSEGVFNELNIRNTWVIPTTPMQIGTSGVYNGCAMFPVVLMGDDDMGAYQNPPTGFYQGTLRPTPIGTNIAPTFGLIPGTTGYSWAYWVPPGTNPTDDPALNKPYISYNPNTYNATIEMDLIVYRGGNEPTTTATFSQPHHLGYVLSFSTSPGPYPAR